MKDRGESGFTFIELLMVLAVLIPALAAITTTTSITTKSLKIDDLNADVMETMHRATSRIVPLVRPCVLSTYQVEATADDVIALRATTVGEWIDPVDLEARTSVRFRSADGVLSMNASSLTSYRVLRFVMDANEADNGIDDDGDGMTDEGQVVMFYDGSEIVLATDLEGCTFTIDRRLIRVEIRAAARRDGGEVVRGRTTETLYVRNN